MKEPEDELFPDFYTDGVGVAHGPYGVSLTFFLSDPLATEPADPNRPGHIVARARLSPDMAKALAKLLTLAARNAPKPGPLRLG